jgi:hypothetical protein
MNTMDETVADGGIASLRSLPFTPGAAPFHIKGTAYRGHMRFVEREIPGGTAAMIDRMHPTMAAFYGQPFLASTFYDIFPLAWGGVVCAELLHMAYLDFVKLRTINQAEADASGIYRVLLTLTSPHSVARRVAQVVGQYFDFGSARVDANEDGLVAVTRLGVPLPIVPWYEKVTEGYSEVLLGRAGAKGLRIACTRRAAGSAYGIPLADLRFDMRFG